MGSYEIEEGAHIEERRTNPWETSMKIIQPERASTQRRAFVLEDLSLSSLSFSSLGKTHD